METGVRVKIGALVGIEEFFHPMDIFLKDDLPMIGDLNISGAIDYLPEFRKI